MKRVGRGIGVVVALHIARGEPELAHVIAAERRDGDQPRAVVFGGHCFHRRQNQQAFVGGRRTFLIAHRPHKDAGVVAVAPDQVFELVQAFGVRRHHASFVEHQHAQLVGGVEQFRRGRIVRRAKGIAAHLLQFAHAEVLDRVRNRRAHPCVILVIAGSLELDGLAVQQEALLGIECADADAEGRLITISDCAAHFDLRNELVQIALFERP